MPRSESILPFVMHLVPWLAALSYLAGAMSIRAHMAAPRPIWEPARRWASVALAAALLPGALLIAGRIAQLPEAPASPGAILAAAMLALAGTIGLVVTRYSAVYLEGEPGQPQYAADLLTTLAAICAVPAADNLPLLLLAWALASRSFHRLLLFYPDRPGARLAAHKKLVTGRIAEVALAGAITLIGLRTGSWNIPEIAAWLARHRADMAIQAAAVLLVAGVALKTAQLPAHGWILQVMEAPTPVSALLHAGIVNLGGYVLLQLAPLLDAALPARILLVAIGGTTAILAALTMLTRVSIKVRLAWSTCAQMGFMLVECGLGFYGLALMHLIGHALYKAHAFLGAGSAVEQQVLERGFGTDRSNASWPVQLIALPAAAALVAANLAPWRLLGAEALPWTWLAVLGVAWGPLLAQCPVRSAAAWFRGVLQLSLLTQLYLALHATFGGTFAPTPSSPGPVLGLAGLLALLAVAQAALPRTRSVRLRQLAYAGLYLDDWLTRLALRWRPRPRPVPAAAAAAGKPMLEGEL